MINKKAIIPVVAIALLLVIIVISVVGFQGWFQFYSTEVFTDAELKTSSANSITIEAVIDGTILIKSDKNNLSISKLSIDGNECLTTSKLEKGINEISISNCLESISTTSPEIVLISDTKVIEKQIYLEKIPKTQTTTPWEKTLNSGDDLELYLTTDGTNFYTTGNLGNSIFTTKYDSAGNQIWNITETRFNSGEGHAIILDNNQNIIVVGGYNNQQTDMVLIKYDKNTQNPLWNITINALQFQQFTGLDVDSLNNIYVTGRHQVSLNDNYFTAKYNSAGTLQWQKTYNGGQNDRPWDLTIDNGDNVIVTGSSAEGDGTYNIFTIKYNSNGNPLWNKTYPKDSGSSAYSVKTDSSNNIYIGGATQGNYLIVKYLEVGTLSWNKTYDSGNADWIDDIFINSAGEILVTGSSNNNILSQKYDSTGQNLLWSDLITTPNWAEGFGIVEDNNGKIAIIGSIENSNTDYFIKKYNN